MDLENIDSILINLTENQARLLKTVVDESTASSGASGLTGVSAGRVASSLRKKGLITPLGKKNRQYKWRLTSGWEEKLKDYGGKKEFVELLNKIEK